MNGTSDIAYLPNNEVFNFWKIMSIVVQNGGEI